MQNHQPRGIILGLILSAFTVAASYATAAPKQQDLLVKFAPGSQIQMQSLVESLSTGSGKAEILTDSWVRIRVSGKRALTTLEALENEESVEYVQPNYKIKLLENYRIEDPLRRAAMIRGLGKQGLFAAAPKPDNLAIPEAPQQATGSDPKANEQWGMADIGVKDAWKVSTGSPEVVVAVIDTGVDYTHEDLLPNLWRNSKEIPNNGIDDDKNGYIDDVIGWDFVSNDNKPYDLAVDPIQLLNGGGNPGHGTHCAGNVAAKGNNALGIAGVAPNVRIMSLRFISDQGQGTTADAIKAIKYAVDNGAKVTSNSWGSEGEDPAEAADNKALRDIVKYAQDHGVLFIAAAGNGHMGVGYSNDTDDKPGFPASYDNENIISVAALDVNNKLGDFSNWGMKTVDIGAPGVNVFSTTVGNSYNNKVIDIGGFEVTWDGTSMAAPHVAGAAALYWSANPNKTWKQVKEAILGSAKKIPALSGKAVSEGKLDVKALLNF
jgi:thermitase